MPQVRLHQVAEGQGESGRERGRHFWAGGRQNRGGSSSGGLLCHILTPPPGNALGFSDMHISYIVGMDPRSPIEQAGAQHKEKRTGAGKDWAVIHTVFP